MSYEGVSSRGQSKDSTGVVVVQTLRMQIKAKTRK